MIRLGAAATNALASRATPAAVSLLPATAVIALASGRCSRAQPSACSTSRCCSTCSSAACAAVTANMCSCSCRGDATAGSTCSRRPRGGFATVSREQHLRRNIAALSTVAPIPGGTESPGSGAPAICDPSAYQSLSLLILLHECTRRVYGSPLVEVDDLLSLPTRVDALPCCVVLLATAGSHVTPSPQRPAPATSSLAAAAPAAAGAVAAGVPSSALEPSYLGASGGTCSGGGAGEVLRMQHVNRAAAEALQPDGRAGEGSLLVEVADADADLLRAMLGARGSPQEGTTRSLRLTMCADRASAGGVGSVGVEPSFVACRTIHCPEALLMPLMSPNGTSAGVAVLFERWEVRDAGGRVALEGRPLVPELAPGCQPGEEALAALQQAVRAQADEVRQLKAAQGLTNKDPQVVAAVAALQQLKAEAELAERLLRAFGGADSVLRRLLPREPAGELGTL